MVANLEDSFFFVTRLSEASCGSMNFEWKHGCAGSSETSPLPCMISHLIIVSILSSRLLKFSYSLLFEPFHEKTFLRSLQPGMTQNQLAR